MRPSHARPLAIIVAQLVVAGLLVASRGGDPAAIALIALAGCLCAVAAYGGPASSSGPGVCDAIAAVVGPA